MKENNPAHVPVNHPRAWLQARRWYDPSSQTLEPLSNQQATNIVTNNYLERVRKGVLASSAAQKTA